MRPSTLLLSLLALLPATMADGVSTSCSTLTSTRTVYRVVTETHTGSPSSNSTTLAPTYSSASIRPSVSANGTTTRAPTSPAPVAPTTASPFPGAAGQMVVPQIMVGVVAAGAGLMFL